MLDKMKRRSGGGGEASVEVQFAQKLAANDPKVREKAVRKLKRWLSGGHGPSEESEMMRVWKGLHYCFWMSDKPLVQEELAEAIADLVHGYGAVDAGNGAGLFLRCFFKTLGREWIGIDRLRLDKFMMLTRRVLRRSFRFALDRDEAVQDLADVFEETVIAANRDGQVRTALGFQLHFTDVFLEELSKTSAICQGEIEGNTAVLLTFLQPFIDELALGKEPRFLDHIEERIFNHLIRQSDVAIAYEEEDSDEDEEEQDLLNSDEEEEEMDGEEEEEEKGRFDLSKSDPRAGVGDVTLPQLEANYEELASVLFKAGSEKEVKKRQRERLYKLTKNFQMLAEGIYPFAIELDENGEPDEDIVDKEEYAINFEKEAKKNRKEVEQEMRKIKKDREEYQQNLKEKIKKEKEAEKSVLSFEPQEKAKNNKSGEEKSKERIEKFQRSRKRPLEEKEEVSTKKQKNNCEEEESTARKVKKKKRKEKQNGQLIPTEKRVSKKADDEPEPKKMKKKAKNVEKQSSQVMTEQKDKKKNKIKGNKTGKEEKQTGKTHAKMPSEKKVKKKKVKEENQTDETHAEITEKKAKKEGRTDDKHTEMVIANHTEKKKGKKKKKRVNDMAFELCNDWATEEESAKIKTPRTLPRATFIKKKLSKSEEGPKKRKSLEGGRRLNFAMSQNKYQSLKEIDQSIQESPDIPFDAEKKPKQGVLKTPSGGGTPKLKQKSLMYNTMINGKSKFAMKRARASDFF